MLKYFFIKHSEYIKLFLILFIALILRAQLAFGNEGTGDTGTWRLGGRTGVEQQQLGMGNGTVYDGDCPTICSNWPPLTFHYMTMMRWLYVYANPLNLPEPGFYKFFPFMGDVGTVAMIYVIGKKLKLKKTLLLSFLYAVHPVALQVAGYHGQRDTIWVFFTLLTIHQLMNKQFLGAASFFALGSSIKIPSLFLAPMFFFKIKEWKNRFAFAGWATLFFLLFNSPEIIVHFDKVFEQVFLYPGFTGWWGINVILNKLAIFLNDTELPTQLAPYHRIMMYVAVIIANFFFGLNSKKYFVGVLGVILTVAIFSPPFASQYLIWALPFIWLLPEKYNKQKIWYSISAYFMSMNFYGGIYGVNLPVHFVQQVFYPNAQYLSYPMDTGFFVWLIMIFLYIKILRDPKLIKHD